MNLINHIIISKLGYNKKLMINSLNGLIDLINDCTFDVIARWRNCDEIIPSNDFEIDLYNRLKSRGYLVDSFDDELIIKESILEALRKKHNTIKSNNKHLTFVMTYDCNFKCSYCFEDTANRSTVNNNRTKTGVMNSALIDAAFDLVGSDLESIGLFGGEPLLLKNRSALEYIVSKAPDKIYSIITNGYYLEEYMDLLTQINISNIMVTLDGEEETHNKRRFLANGKPTYKKIMVGITKCLENNIPICIRMNLDDSNYGDANNLKLKLLEQFYKYKDLLSFEISPMLETPIYEKNNMYSELYDSDIEYTVEERQKRNRFLSEFSPIVNAITTNERLAPVYSYCYAHDNGFLVDPNGNIFPCLLTVGIDELAIGRYYPNIEFKENSVRNRNIDKIPECRECIYSLLCGGGCVLSLCDYSNVFKPECLSIKNQIHNIIPMFYNINNKPI